LYNKIVVEGLKYHESLPDYSAKPARGRVAHRTGYNLLMRLSNYRADVLRFVTVPEVPFSNNQAEQDIRMMKVKQKISGGFRTTEGAQVFVTIRSFISTMRKQGKNIFDSLAAAVAGNVPTVA
jgi:transposase